MRSLASHSPPTPNSLFLLMISASQSIFIIMLTLLDIPQDRTISLSMSLHQSEENKRQSESAVCLKAKLERAYFIVEVMSGICV